MNTQTINPSQEIKHYKQQETTFKQFKKCFAQILLYIT